MTREQIFDQALETVKKRRLAAIQEQERRSDQIRREIPETAELDRQLRAACMEIVNVLGQPGSAEKVRAVAQHSMDADKMLRQLLVAKGYPADYLDLHYTCTECNDTGFCRNRPCKCLVHEIGRIGAEALNRQSPLALSSFQSFSLSYYSSLPTEQYQAMERILNTCRSYAEDFSPERSGSLMMLGDTGLGKTHLSLAVAGALLEKGFSVIYDSAGSLLRKMENDQFRRGGSDPQEDTASLLQECDLLILDDFGTEFDYAYNRSAVYTLINGRISSGKPIIVNTNLTLKEIQARYGDRILSRLLSSSNILQFYGKDIRIQQRIRSSGGQEGTA